MIKNLLILLIVSTGLLGVISKPLTASSVKASSFGWTGVDDTQALISAFTSNVDTVIVDLQAGAWVSGPLIFDGSPNPVINNRTIIFERGVVVKALAGAYDSYLYNGLLSFVGSSNVSLIGYGATLQMNKQEYIALNDGSEWRHVISLSGCNDFDIFGLELLDSGGDGIEVSGIYQLPIPSTNIHIKDCRIDNNYRQGISVTSAKNVIIEYCEITNTSGTLPTFGIDLEPDKASDDMSGIEIRNCRITGNEGGGILLAFWQLNQTTSPVSVNVTDCYIGSNLKNGIAVDVNSNGPVSGYANFERCIIENQPGNAIYSNKRESLSLLFKNIVIRNVGTNGGNYDMPIFIERQYDYSGFPLGNITFDKVFIDDHLFTRDFLDISHWGEATQVENVTGDFSVYNPNGVTYYIEPPLVNVTISTDSIPSLPVASVGISTTDAYAYEIGTDTTASFTISSTALNKTTNSATFPIGILYDVSGDADNRLDYHYFQKATVIPANASDTTYNIIAILDELIEPMESITLTIQSHPHLTVTNANTTLFIGDDPVPVELTTFTGSYTGNLVELNWQTATEVNNYGFEIQRRMKNFTNEPSDWSKIGFVEGHGNSNSPKVYSFSDNTISESGKYLYRLKQIDIDGTYEYSQEIEVEFGIPDKYELYQNYPNPFNPTTTIKYTIPSSVISNPQRGERSLSSKISPSGRNDIKNVRLTIYDILGREVTMLVNKEQKPGNYQIAFDASQLSAGMYFYELRSGDFKAVKKMLLVK